jgi:hypothetical protein
MSYWYDIAYWYQQSTVNIADHEDAETTDI